MFDLLSRSDADSERFAMQLQAKAIVLNRLIAPYIQACDKYFDNETIEEGQKVGQDITRHVFADWRTFCAEQQKRFQEK
jgi:hypothetical protein